MLIPLLFMGDIVGRLFREFAITLAVTILVSAVVSLTLTPMMCAQTAEAQARVRAERASIASPKSSSTTSSRRTAGRCSSFCATASSRCWSPSPRWSLTLLLYIVVPKGFFPVQDTGVILGITEAPQTVSLHQHGRSASRGSPTSSCRTPPSTSLSSFIGIDGTNTTLNTGRIQINLKPLDAAQDLASRRSFSACSPS